MALFYFILKIGRQTFPDPVGEEFDDLTCARAHAHVVARELMRNREGSTGHWRLQVCDDYLQPCYECLFAEINQRLEPYGEDFRGCIVRVARTTANLREAIGDVDRATSDLRQTMADLKQTMRLLDAAMARVSQTGL